MSAETTDREVDPGSTLRGPGPTLWQDGRPTPAERDVLDWLLTTTRSARKTLDLTRPVEREVIEECLQIALQAPSGHNEQRWHWVVVTDPVNLRLIAEAYRSIWEAVTRGERRKIRRFRTADQAAERNQASAHWLPEHLHEVPVMVLPCLTGPKPSSERLRSEWDRWMSVGEATRTLGPDSYDALTTAYWATIYPAVWSFQLALRSRGLGSVLTAMHVGAAEWVAKELGLPPGVQQTCLLPVAYLTKTDFQPAKRAPLETRISWNQWLGKR